MADYTVLPSDKIEAILCERLETIRLDQNITQANLAAEAGVSPRTIRRMEKGEGISLATFIRVLKALKLENRLTALLPQQQISPMDRVNRKTHVRERASGRRKKEAKDDTPWKWGDE